MELIGWILIGICCFYIVRNLYVGSIMFPCGYHIVAAYNGALGNRFFLKIRPKYRNYYLVVLNPFWWKFLDVYQDDEDGRKLKYKWKQFRDAQKNSKNFK
jgi:hypothetical protein